MQGQRDAAFLEAAALRAIDDATTEGDFDPERTRVVGVKVSVSKTRKQGQPVLHSSEAVNTAQNESVGEMEADLAPAQRASNDRKPSSYLEAADASSIPTDNSTDIESLNTDRGGGEIQESDLSIDTHDYMTASESEALMSDPLTQTDPVGVARVTECSIATDQPSNAQTQQQRFERDADLMEEAVLQAIEKAKSSGEFDPEKSAIQGVRVAVDIRRVEGQADSFGRTKTIEETKDHSEMEVNKAFCEPLNSDLRAIEGTEDALLLNNQGAFDDNEDRLSGETTPKHENLKRQKEVKSTTESLHWPEHAPHPHDILLSLDEEGDFADFADDDVVPKMVPAAPEASKRSIPSSGAGSEITKTRGNGEVESVAMNRLKEEHQEIGNNAELLRAAAARAITDATSTGKFNPEQSTVRDVKVSVSKTQRSRTNTGSEAANRIVEETVNACIEGAIEGSESEAAASLFLLSPQVENTEESENVEQGTGIITMKQTEDNVNGAKGETNVALEEAELTEALEYEGKNEPPEDSEDAPHSSSDDQQYLPLSPQIENTNETENVVDDTAVTNLEPVSMQREGNENDTKDQTSEPALNVVLEEGRPTEEAEYEGKNEPPKVRMSAGHTANEDQSQFGISQRVYGTAKCLWSFGKTVPIGGRMLALSEVFASSIISWGSQGQIENLAYLDEAFIGPHMEDFDKKIADPAISTALRVVSSAVEKGDSFIRPAVGALRASIQGRFGFIMHRSTSDDISTNIDSTLEKKFDNQDTSSEPPSLPPAQHSH